MTFHLSQLFLIIAIFGFAVYVFRLRSILFDRLIYLLLITAGIIFTIHPPFSAYIANFLGIGRGVDVVIYVFIIFALFQMVATSAHLLQQDRQITLLVRQCALLSVQQGPQPAPDQNDALSVNLKAGNDAQEPNQDSAQSL